MYSNRYILQFYAANSNNKIIPLAIRHHDSPHLLVSDNPYLKLYDGIVRRINKILENHPNHPELSRVSLLTNDNTEAGIIYVLLANIKHLQNPRFFYSLCDGPLRQTDVPPGCMNKEVKKGKLLPRPIITISPADIFSIYEESPGLDFEAETTIPYWRDIRNERKALYDFDLDHRVKFLDSSIWHRYVPTDEEFDNNFANTLEAIVGYADIHLYESLAALATLEFHCRMLQNSFIANYGDRGHQEAVTPFKFHSETIMSRKAKKILNDFFNIERDKGWRLADMKWNILMVDDYSDRKIALLEASEEKSSTNASDILTKKHLIEKVLNAVSGPDNRPILNLQIAADTKGEENIIANAIDILSSPQGGTFDIILLDYLLGKSELNPNLKAYGHEFLLELATSPTRRSFRQVPMGRHWIFPISSFPFAFWDKLRQMNLDGSNEQWHISGGGDPIVTPELFRVNFYRLLSRQIAEFYLHEAALERWINQFSAILTKEEWTRAVRAQLFADRAKVKVLSNGRENGSAFAESMEAFLNAQEAYNSFWDGFIAWIQGLDSYKYGSPTAELFDQMGTLLGGPDGRYWHISQRIEQQVKRLLRDAEEELREITRQLREKQGKKLVFNKQSLFSFPLDVPNVSPEIESIDLSENNLSDFTLLPGQWPNLREVNLSNNKDLETLSASELKNRPNLLKINLRNTKLAEKMGWQNAYTNDREDSQHLLQEIEKYLQKTQSKPPKTLYLANKRPLKIFIAYAHADHNLKEELKTHLSTLCKAQLIELWDEDRILPGDDQSKWTTKTLNDADIFLPLISADFIDSTNIMEYLNTVVLPRHARNECKIVPVFLRKCDIEGLELGKLKGLPAGPERPVSSYPNRDEAFYQVSLGLKILVESWN